ncbi:Ig-like domain-containing protein (plasmid) [Pantoea agglomerans]|uniref:Ig-like domain-containing protein n=1 Tax=Enterobacter agglomerans TaxID=549 RepID=UPI002899F85C|nr:Ig-like domain-containing protein [Pantoea agglomerans]WNK60504.1 Ig-like domain-containing protein [Pantoea agglomerans]
MVVTRRVGNNLQLFFSQDDSQHPDIVLEDYYDNENVHLIGLGENGQFYEYVPTSGDVAEYPPALTEGQSGEQVLGGEGYASADPLTASDNNFGWLPFMLLGGAAGGVAIGASGRGSSGHDSSAKSVSVTLDPVADSDNDGRPEFSGTSNSPDSQVVIQLPDGTQITTQTDSEGNWYVEAPTSQPNGTVTVTVTDSAGNSGSLTEEFTDTSSPEAAVINSNDDEQISGKAEPGSTVVISDGSTGETTTVVVDENGDWSIQPNPVNEGDTDVTIVVVDPAGNVSPPSNGSRPDITPPDNINSGIVSDSVTLTDDVGAITGEIASGSVTDDARPTLSGDATADIDHVNIYDNGELVGSAAVDADGKWSWTPEQDMADGTSHDLTVAAVDAAGNEGPQADGDWSFTVDTSTAAPEITNNTEDELAGNAEPGAVIVITDPVSDSVTSTVADADGHWSIQPNPAGVDAKDVVVEATDEAGNSNSVVIDGPGDSTPPDNQTSGLVIDSITLTDDVGAITGEIASGSVTDDARPTLSGDATADIDHVNIYDNGELVGSAAVDADGKWSWTPEQDMADGTSHDLTVAAVDAAGNEGPQADGDWSFTVDTSTAAPEITNNTEDELAGNAEPGAVIVITDPVSDSVTSTVADADGHWSIQPNPAGVDAKDVVVEATDEAGNSNSVVIDGPGDSTPPDNQTSGLVIDSITLTDDVGAITGEIASGSVTDDARPTLSGDATADIDHVNIYDNGELVGSAAVDADGKWSWTPEQDMADGTSHDLTVAAVDAAGNEGPQADGDWSFTVDTSTAAPEITNNTEDELAGNAEPGAVIVITDPVSDSVTSTVADADGHWSIQPNPAGVDAKDVVVEATDEAGNSNSVVIDGPGDSTPPDNQTSGLVIDSITLTDDVGAITGEIASGSVTDDARPTLSGDATADIDHVNIYDNGELVGSAAVDADGKWSWTPEQDMADGTSHDLTVAAVDAAGNEGPQADGDWSFTVDTSVPDNQTSGLVADSITLTDDVGPVQGKIEDGSVTDDARPTYSGTTTADISYVNIYDSGKLIGSAAVEADGKWSWTPDSAMSSGAHALTVAAVDAAGNEGPQVSGTADAAWDFSVLTSAPAQPAIENVVDDYSQGEDADSGFLQKGQFTNDGTLTLNGTAGAGLTVIVWATDADGNRVNAGSGVADDNGRWSITTAALGEDGRYDLTATAVNAAGVSSAETGAFNVVLDTVAPEAAVAALMDAQGEVQGEVASGGVTDDRAPVLKGTAEAGATVTVYLDDSSTPAGSTVADADGNWTLSLGTLTDRDYSWQVKVTDAAGNETRGERATFRLDSSSVELSIDQANDDAGSITGAVLNGGLTDDSTPELQGTAAAGAVVTISDQSGAVLGSSMANSSGVWTFAVAELADGEHVFTASVTNAAGNSSEAKFTLNVDTTPPEPVIIQSLQDDVGTLQFTSPVAGNVIDDPAPTFTGKAEKGSLVTLYDNGILLATVTADAQGEWSYTPTTNLLEGTHGITATATDAAGNVSEISSSWDFIIDITAPNVGISGNSEESLSGVTEPGVVVVIVDKNGTEYSVVADQQGKWVIAPNPISAGESGEIYAIDPAGNKGDTVAFQGSALATYSLLNESMQVNTTTTGDQLNPSTTRLADGRIVVTWQGAGVSGTEVYMQLFEADGIRKIGTEQQVNQRTANNQDSPQVIALTDGGFLIVYESNVNGLDNSGDGVMARRYGADGQAVTDEFQVNTTYSGAQNRPGAMATADGGYIISWEDQGTGIVQRSYGADNQPVTGEVTVATGKGMGSSGGPEMAAFTDAAHGGMYVTVWNATSGPGDTSGSGVVGQIFAADGTPLGGNFQVNTTTDSSQNYPDVITLNDGSIVVFWDSSDSGTSGSDIRAVHYRVDAATGTLTLVGSGDFIVNSYTSGKQYKPVGVALDDGGYLLIWGSEGGDGDGSAIYAQRFDANDNRVGREFLVNTTTSGNQGTGGDSVDATHIFDAVLTADGSVYVTWQSDNVDGSGTGIEGIVIDVDAAFYSEYTVNTTTTGAQTVSSVASLPDGGAIVVWQSASGDGSGSCVKGQLLDAKGQPVGAEFTVNTTTAGDQITPQVTVLSDGTFQVVWSTDSGAHIKGQGYTYSYDGAGNVNGVVTNGAEYNVDSSTAASKMRVPVITSLEDGGYLVVWEASLNGNWTVYGRQYDANGTPVTAETVLATTTLNANAIIPEWEPLPSVTTLENGQVAITYAIKATGYDVGVSVYDPSTHAVTGSFVANQTLTNNQASSAVSALQNGNYVVTWDSNDTSGPDQNGYSVWGRIYAADGTALTSEFLINTTTAGDQHMARVVSQADGSFIAVFLSTTDIAPGAGTSGIYAQYFDAAGNKVGQQIQINQLTYGEQVEVDATFLAGGQLYVTWTDQGVGDGDGSAIKGRLVDLNETLGLTSETGSTHIEYQPAQYDLNGTSGNDVLDARGANSVDAKEGDDTIVINSTHFSSVKGGEGHDTLVWDSNNDLELGTVSGKISGIEAIHLGNNTAQTLFISASDVLEITKDNGSEANTLHITGDVGSSNNSNATDTVNIGKSEWTASAAQTENGVNYDVYTNNDDTTVKLLIQHGLNVI